MISSTANPTVKRLRQLHERRGRVEQGLYLVEGVRLVTEALDGAMRPHSVLVAPDVLRATARGRALHERLLYQGTGSALLEVTPSLLRYVTATETPSGVVAAMPLPARVDLATLPQRSGLALVLDNVADPGNAGTILRTAMAASVDAVVALKGCVDLYAPKVVRAGMGAHIHLAVATDVETRELAPWLAARGQVLLADAHAADSIYSVDLCAPTVLVVGSEAHGAARAAELLHLRPIAIPMPGAAESLNVAAATAVILFEALRQRSG